MIEKSDPRGLPWIPINDYIAEIGAARTRADFYAAVPTAIHTLIPYDAEGAFVLAMGPCLASVGVSPRRMESYTSYYQFRVPPAEDLRHGELPESYGIPIWLTWGGKYRNTEFVTDFMVPGGCHKTLSGVMPGRRLVLGLHRSRLAPGFSDMELAIMSSVSPHIGNLYAIWEKLEDVASAAPEVATVLELFPDLTPREAEVTSLLCSSLTGPEIATRLFISRRTVDAHVAHIYEKLGIQNRRALRQLLLSLRALGKEKHIG
jgi:DNA-binding CsgD family transcriptional regulator